MSWSPTRSNTHFRIAARDRSRSPCVRWGRCGSRGRRQRLDSPVNLDFRSPSTLGLKLVAIFTEQVGGTMELTREEGTRFSLRFTPGTRS